MTAAPATRPLTSRPSCHHRRGLALLAGSLALAAATTVRAQATLTAEPALAPISLPPVGTADGQFELMTVGAGSFMRNPSWGAWQFDIFSGIAHETSGLASGNPPAPSGDRVAYLAGPGKVTVTANLAAGVWRLRYRMAARNQGGVLNDQTVAITVNGNPVAQELELASNYTSYTTRPFHVTVGGLQSIKFEGSGTVADIALFDDVALEPVREWVKPASWSPPATPQAGDTVIIPSGSVIGLLGAATAGGVQIGGELVVTDTKASLTADSVMVMGSGARLEVGRLEAPVAAKGRFELTLTGPYTATNSKFLIARDGGRIDMHGSPKTSWTRLTATGNPGDFSIQVKDATGWEVGDEIVIAGSEGQALPGIASTNFQSYAERFSVRGITGNTIDLGMPGIWFFSASLARLHVSSSLNYPVAGPSNWTVEQHAEVGMLSHNVVVTSVPVPVPGLSPSAMFGGHIMIMGDLSNNVGQGYFSSVELSKMGQTGELGRYPMHWHMCREGGAGQYIVDCSIHESFNRAVTIHGTDETASAGNVGFRNLGHAFFLEDGSEQDNVIRDNLAIETLKPVPGDEVIPSDNSLDGFQNRTPAAFWITNPKNTFVGNVATDTIGTGFWFALPRQVLGLSNPATPNAIPHNFNDTPNLLDLTEFRDNVAHGCRNGFDVHDGIEFGTDEILTNVTWVPASGEARIEDFLAYACATGIYSGNGDNDQKVVYDRAMLVDNIINTRQAASDRMENPLFVADTGNGLFVNSPVSAVGKEHEAYRLYDGAPRVEGGHFDGFHIADFSRLFGSNGAALRRTNHTFVGSTFNPAVAIAQPRCEFADFSLDPLGGTGQFSNAQSPADPRSWGFSVWDETGDIYGSAGSIIGNHPWMLDGNEVAYINGPSDPSIAFFTPQRFGHLFVRQPGVSASNLPEITFTRIKAGLPMRLFIHDYTIDQQKQMPVIVNKDSNSSVDDFLYVLDWTNVNGSPNNGLPTSNGNPSQAELLLRLGSVFADDSVLVLLKLQQPGVTVTIAGTPIASTNSFADLRQSPAGGAPLMLVTAAGDVYMRVMNLATRDFLEINW